jgi:hypothetical protein
VIQKQRLLGIISRSSADGKWEQKLTVSGNRSSDPVVSYSSRIGCRLRYEQGSEGQVPLEDPLNWSGGRDPEGPCASL